MKFPSIHFCVGSFSESSKQKCILKKCTYNFERFKSKDSFFSLKMINQEQNIRNWDPGPRPCLDTAQYWANLAAEGRPEIQVETTPIPKSSALQQEFDPRPLNIPVKRGSHQDVKPDYVRFNEIHIYLSKK